MTSVGLNNNFGDLSNKYQINKISNYLSSSPEQKDINSNTQTVGGMIVQLSDLNIVSLDIESQRDDKFEISSYHMFKTNLLAASTGFNDQTKSLQIKQTIILRFAIKFLFDKVLEKNNPKIDEAVAILNDNLELKEAVKMVLAELDNQEAIERFNQIFNPQTVDNPKEAPTSSTKPSNKTYTPTGTDEANYTAVTTPFINKTKVAGQESLQCIEEAKESHTIAVRGMNMNPDNIDDQIKHRQEFQKARYMAQLSNQKRAEFVLQLMKNLSAYNLTEQDREGLSEFIEQIDRHGLRVYFFASRLRSVVTINFETNEISVDKKNPEYIKALDKIMLNRKGVSFEKADEWLSGAIIKAIVIKQLLDMDKELENTAQQMDEIIVDVENKIQIINQRIETLKLREDYIKAKEIVKKFFEGIKLNITDFFRSYSEKAAKLMIESMLFCTRQDRANLINIRRILDKNLALLMKEFKKDFVIKSNNKQIERAIDVVITVYQKDNQKDMDNFG